jgi:hypothetical protein
MAHFIRGSFALLRCKSNDDANYLLGLHFHQVFVYKKCIVLNSFHKQQVILIIVIFSLTTGVDSSSTGTSSMKNFCPKPNPAPCFISHQRKLCALMEETKDDFTTVHWIQSEHVAPAPSQQHR